MLLNILVVFNINKINLSRTSLCITLPENVFENLAFLEN